MRKGAGAITGVALARRRKAWILRAPPANATDHAVWKDAMPHSDRILRPDETLLYVSRVHWVVYLPGAALIAFGMAAAWLLRGFAGAAGYSIPSLIALAIGVSLGGIGVARAWWRRLTVEVAVTDHRIIYRHGLLRRHTFEMGTDKIESVHVDQSVLGRVLDYGDITVRGTGSSFEPLRTIASPVEFHNQVIAA
jgi:uncharacterized membrane protein YdbT with pleckstrin-like domain